MTSSKRLKAKQLPKEKIIKAAIRLFAKLGYESTSMSGIAKSVGLEKASLYYHFKDKDELFAAVTETVWGKIAADIRNFDRDPRFIKKSPQYILGYIIEHVLDVTIKSGLAMVKLDRANVGIRAHCEAALCHIQEMRLSLRKFLKANRVRQVEIAEQVIINAIHAYVLHLQQRQDRIPVKKYSQYLASLFV